MWWANNLFSGFSFLVIHEQVSFLKSKRVIELIIPTALTAGLMGLYFYDRYYFHSDIIGILDNKLFQLIVFMVPFHLAALAALATFQSPILDEEMPGAAASLRKWNESDRAYYFEPIKMREYACRLFGYLCTLGVIYLVLSILASILQLPYEITEGLSALIIGCMTFFFWHYILMSLFAIYFLVAKTVP